MRILRRVIEIVTQRDIDWMELFAGWITLGFCVCLLAPGNYFATNPRLASMQYAGPVYIPEWFWITCLSVLGFFQSVAVAAGDKAIVLFKTASRSMSLNPYLVRMRVSAMSVGVWLAVSVLAWPSASIWYVWGFPVVTTLAEWLFVGLALFSLCASLRMAAEVGREQNSARRRSVLREAESYVRLYQQVEAMAASEQQTSEYQNQSLK